jgi:hypothetical protein
MINDPKHIIKANKCCIARLIEEFETHPNLNDSLFVLLICISKNIGVEFN